jgi:hypothetical protein
MDEACELSPYPRNLKNINEEDFKTWTESDFNKAEKEEYEEA